MKTSFNLSEWALRHRSLVWYFMAIFAVIGRQQMVHACCRRRCRDRCSCLIEASIPQRQRGQARGTGRCEGNAARRKLSARAGGAIL